MQIGLDRMWSSFWKIRSCFSLYIWLCHMNTDAMITQITVCYLLLLGQWTCCVTWPYYVLELSQSFHQGKDSRWEFGHLNWQTTHHLYRSLKNHLEIFYFVKIFTPETSTHTHLLNFAWNCLIFVEKFIQYSIQRWIEQLKASSHGAAFLVLWLILDTSNFCL